MHGHRQNYETRYFYARRLKWNPYRQGRSHYCRQQIHPRLAKKYQNTKFTKQIIRCSALRHGAKLTKNIKIRKQPVFALFQQKKQQMLTRLANLANSCARHFKLKIVNSAWTGNTNQNKIYDTTSKFPTMSTYLSTHYKRKQHNTEQKQNFIP